MRSAAERFARLTRQDPSGCVLWVGAVQSSGYASFGIRRGVSVLAHRFAYEQRFGAIPAGLTIDHVDCVSKLCVNPEHLEPVTSAENTRRAAAKQTHCKRGHWLGGDNLKIRADGRRRCVACNRMDSWARCEGRPYRRKPMPADALAEVSP